MFSLVFQVLIAQFILVCKALFFFFFFVRNCVCLISFELLCTDNIYVVLHFSSTIANFCCKCVDKLDEDVAKVHCENRVKEL